MAVLTKDELFEADYPWTIIDGKAYGIGPFIHAHPGGALIRRAIGEDATELFRTHHASQQSLRKAVATLKRYELGYIEHGKHQQSAEKGIQDLLGERVSHLMQPSSPLAEIVAVTMFLVFVAWSYAAYGLGWWKSNLALSWFWWRHFDSGLHSAVHGDFSWRRKLHRILFIAYSTMSHHSLEYYYGAQELGGLGMSRHFQHHIHTNDPTRDPDWESMQGRPWVRRHHSVVWKPFHRWQTSYWWLVQPTLENLNELLSMFKRCVDSIAALLEPPDEPLQKRLQELLSVSLEVLLNPGYQGLSFFCQPFHIALPTLLAARAISRLVLYPFAEVQHYMPEHVLASDVLYPSTDTKESTSCAAGGGICTSTSPSDAWLLTQLRTTANLRLHWKLSRWVDFLMFHGDSYQIEHHLWPAMSFVHFPAASAIVKATCTELGLPYQEVSYWEGYLKILEQIQMGALPSMHSHDAPAEERVLGVPSGESEADDTSSQASSCPPHQYGHKRTMTQPACEEEISHSAGPPKKVRKALRESTREVASD